MRTNEESRAKLKSLQHRLSIEAPLARARPDAPAELVMRLRSALVGVSSICLLDPRTAMSVAAQQAQDDALLEGRLALSDWARWLECANERAKTAALTAIDRRRSERHETRIIVKLLRCRVRDGVVGEMTLDSPASSHAARNVSLGGMFVDLPFDGLPHIRVGSIVDVWVGAAVGAQQLFPVRAVVTRRDGHGIALSWIRDCERVRRAIDSLLATIAGSRRSA